MANKHDIVAGTIGAGKSTFTEILAQNLETNHSMIMMYCHSFVQIQINMLFYCKFSF